MSIERRIGEGLCWPRRYYGVTGGRVQQLYDAASASWAMSRAAALPRRGAG